MRCLVAYDAYHPELSYEQNQQTKSSSTFRVSVWGTGASAGAGMSADTGTRTDS